MAQRTIPDPPTDTALFSAPRLGLIELKRLLKGEQPLDFRFIQPWRLWLETFVRDSRRIVVRAVLDFPDTPAQTSSSRTVSVPGLDLDHFVEVVAPLASVLDDSFYDAYASAENVATVRFHNYSAGALNPDEGEFTLIVRNSVK